MADSTSDVVGSAAAEVGTEPGPPQTSPEVRPERTEAFDTLVEDLRKVYVLVCGLARYRYSQCRGRCDSGR